MSDKARQISALLSPTVESLGLELLGAEYLPAPGGATLRLYIDVPQDVAVAEPASAQAPAGDSAPRMVTIEDCEAVSREVSAQLDVEDPITGNYTLEVSSPGVDRPLFTLGQFQRHLGESAKLVLRLPQDGRRRLQGPITRIDGERVVVLVDGVEMSVAFENIDKARVMPDWVALGFAPQPKKTGAGNPDAAKKTPKPAAKAPAKKVAPKKKTPARKPPPRKSGAAKPGPAKPKQPAAKRPRAE